MLKVKSSLFYMVVAVICVTLTGIKYTAIPTTRLILFFISLIGFTNEMMIALNKVFPEELSCEPCFIIKNNETLTQVVNIGILISPLLIEVLCII